jgi:hypothetical protein
LTLNNNKIRHTPVLFSKKDKTSSTQHCKRQVIKWTRLCLWVLVLRRLDCPKNEHNRHVNSPTLVPADFDIPFEASAFSAFWILLLVQVGIGLIPFFRGQVPFLKRWPLYWM